MTTDNQVDRQYAPRQFSLAGLLSFFLACGIYFGLLSTTVGSMDELLFTTRTSPWRLISTIVISWGGLWALYRQWRLKAAMVVHYTGPMACGMLALVALPLSLLANTIKESAQFSLHLFLYGPFISVLFGFPVVVVMLIYRVLKRE